MAPSDAAAATPRLKAVIIVGPSSGSTNKYLDEAEEIADSAAALGMDVRRIYHPRATWERVLANIQGANYVVFFGHGNGWPSPYAPFNAESKDGFGLNPYEGASAYSTKYYGEDPIRRRIDLAPHAVVLLSHLCYASGNGEPGMSTPSASTARERVDNFASGFLDAGAGVVFAFGWKQKMDLAKTLMTTDQTMDQVFMTPGSAEWYTGYVGWNDIRFQSERVDGARGHLDPHPRYGYYRAITGDLGLTTQEWRGATPDPDATPPQLTDVAADANADGSVTASDAKPAPFTPNGDGLSDELTVDHTLSEPAYVDVAVSDAHGSTIRKFSDWHDQGRGSSTWDGRDASGEAVAEGIYRLTLVPRDASDNVGEPATVSAAALTAVRAPRASAALIHVRDGDALSATSTISATLTRDARVSLRVVQGQGETVRTVLVDEPRQAGELSWNWDGTDDTGAPVADGRYFGVLSATTEVGTITHHLRVRVGQYRLEISDTTPRRGQDVKFVLRVTEPLRATPTLTIKQSGLIAYTREMAKVDGSRYKLVLRLRTGGPPGTLRVRASGTDTGGQLERGSWSFPLR